MGGIRASFAATLVVLVMLVFPADASADSAKLRGVLAAKTVSKALDQAGLKGAVVTAAVPRLSAASKGEMVEIRCQVRVVIGSRSGRRLGAGQTATLTGSGRLTIARGSKRSTVRAKRACIREVSRALAKRRAARFLAPRVTRR